LAAIYKIAFEQIPQDPTINRYRQGSTLGEKLKHWFREKFGNGRFRLFFRYDSKSKVIIYAWVNDSQTLRQYGSKSDAYVVFAGMLKNGNPPDTWELLKRACDDPKVQARLAKLFEKKE
jgi:toxin YhaV